MPNSTRPLGVTVVSILWSVAAVYLLLKAWEMSNGMFGGQKAPSWLAPALVQRAPYLAVFGVAFGIVGFGLWNMQNWARTTALVCSSLDLAWCAWTLFLGGGLTTEVVHYRAFWLLLMRTAIEAIICVYLMREVVNKKFQEAW